MFNVHGFSNLHCGASEIPCRIDNLQPTVGNWYVLHWFYQYRHKIRFCMSLKQNKFQKFIYSNKLLKFIYSYLSSIIFIKQVQSLLKLMSNTKSFMQISPQRCASSEQDCILPDRLATQCNQVTVER